MIKSQGVQTVNQSGSVFEGCRCFVLQQSKHPHQEGAAIASTAMHCSIRCITLYSEHCTRPDTHRGVFTRHGYCCKQNTGDAVPICTLTE